MYAPADCSLTAVLTSKFPSLTNAPALLRSMNAQPLFKQGETSQNVITLLERIQHADPDSPDLDEDNRGASWGHYQFTAGGLTLSSSLTTWRDVGSVATAFKLVAAALKTCQDARRICANISVSAFLSDVYLGLTLERLEECWVGAGAVSVYVSLRFHAFTVSRRLLFLLLVPHALLPQLHIVTSQSHPRVCVHSKST